MNYQISARTLALSSLVFAAACGPTDSDSDGLGANDGSPGAADARNFIDGAIYPDASCGAQTTEIPLVELGDPPDLLIVLDRSGSMDLNLDTIPLPIGESRWDIMEDAIESISTTYNTNIRFGLTAFPGGGDICGITAGADVAIADSNAAAINSWMSSNSPTGNTPAHLALQNALNIYSGLPVNPGGRYVLFATDGAPNCGGNPVDPEAGSGDETVAAVEALRAQGIDTFVLGFGSSFFGLDTGVLEDAAQAGGQPAPGGPPHYYHADDAPSLEAALMAIAGGIVVPSCSFEVSETPPEPDRVTVSIAGTPIPRDPGHNNGWDYHPDESTITFFGEACEAVQEGETNVSFVFGCPGPTVE